MSIKMVFLGLLGVAALGVIAVLALASRKPDVFRVERSAVIAAPADRIYPHIADLKAMDRWSPFLQKDPTAKVSYSGPASGVGAASEFRGNGEVGAGSVRIVGATAPSRVDLKLDMTKPMEVHNDVAFTLVPEGANATRVTWSMAGPAPFTAKVMDTVFGMDRMVGGAFDAGLSNLRVAVERG